MLTAASFQGQMSNVLFIYLFIFSCARVLIVQQDAEASGFPAASEGTVCSLLLASPCRLLCKKKIRNNSMSAFHKYCLWCTITRRHHIAPPSDSRPFWGERFNITPQHFWFIVRFVQYIAVTTSYLLQHNGRPSFLLRPGQSRQGYIQQRLWWVQFQTKTVNY